MASITLENERLLVTGDLNFKTVLGLWSQSLSLISQCQQLDFDLSNVMTSNSAGLALIIEWIKLAKRTGKAISFHDIPPQLISIAAVSGFGAIIP